MSDLNDLVARLRQEPPGDDSLAWWRTTVGHPWSARQLARAAARLRAGCRPRVPVEDLVQEAVAGLARRGFAALDLARPCPEIGAFLTRRFGWAVRDAARRTWGENCTRPLAAAAEPPAAADFSADVRELIERLPRVQRRVVKLRVKAYTFAQIAGKVGMSLSGVYAAYRRACRSLGGEL